MPGTGLYAPSSHLPLVPLGTDRINVTKSFELQMPPLWNEEGGEVRETFLVLPGPWGGGGRSEPPVDHSDARQVETRSPEALGTPGGELARKEALHLGVFTGPQVREGRPNCVWEAEGLPSGVSRLRAQGSPHETGSDGWRQPGGSQLGSFWAQAEAGAVKSLSATSLLPQTGDQSQGGSARWKATQRAPDRARPQIQPSCPLSFQASGCFLEGGIIKRIDSRRSVNLDGKKSHLSLR